MTKEQQVQLGRQAMAEVYQQMPVLPDSSPQTQYVRQLGKRLADVIPQEYSWPFEFHVLPQKISMPLHCQVVRCSSTSVQLLPRTMKRNWQA